MDAIYQFWGKAAGARDGEPPRHPLVYHCLDVADALLAQYPRRLDALATLLRTTPDNARNLLVALMALYDVGKFAEAFQCKCEAARPRVGRQPGPRAPFPAHAGMNLEWACAAGLPKGVVLMDAAYGKDASRRARMSGLGLPIEADFRLDSVPENAHLFNDRGALRRDHSSSII